MKIVASDNSGRYLIVTNPDDPDRHYMAILVDANLKIRWSPWPLDCYMKFSQGEWQDCGHNATLLEELLAYPERAVDDGKRSNA